MLDKYFGFLRIQDEFSIIESLLEYTRIDEEEISLLLEMLQLICSDDHGEVDSLYSRITMISSDSSRIFETVADQIVQANFDIRKQYDLLRLYQRIDKLSKEILTVAYHILVLSRIEANVPKEFHKPLLEIGNKLMAIHQSYSSSMRLYLDSKKDVMMSIHKVEQEEYEIDKLCIQTSEILYRLGNERTIPLGTYSVIQELIRSFKDLASAIEVTATSLDWLLLSR